MKAFDCDFCQSSHFLGAAGECSADNTTCFCPEGYSGRDDWETFSGCQVNEDLQFFLHSLVEILSWIGLIVSVICFIILLKKWKFRFGVSSTMAPENGFSLFVRPKFINGSSRMHSDLALRHWKRRVYTLYALLANVFYFIGGIIFFHTVLKGDIREDQNNLLDIGIYIALAACVPASCLVVLVWYYALPDVAMYGRLLQLDRIIIRFPGFVPNSILWTIIVTEIYFFPVGIVLPFTDYYDKNANLMNTLLIVGIAVLILIVLILFWITISTVEAVFSKAIVSFQKSASSRFVLSEARQADLKIMKKAMVPLKIVKWIGTLVVLFDLLLEIANLATGLSQIYLFLNLNFLFFFLFMGSSPICFVLLEKYLTPMSVRNQNNVVTRAPASSTEV